MWLLKLFKITDPAYINVMSHAGTIGLHMVSGIAVGTVIGYFLDDWLGTSPWLTIIFMVLGIIAGYKNVYVDTKRLILAQKENSDKGVAPQPAARSQPAARPKDDTPKGDSPKRDTPQDVTPRKDNSTL